jgi:hypothetical protein
VARANTAGSCRATVATAGTFTLAQLTRHEFRSTKLLPVSPDHHDFDGVLARALAKWELRKLSGCLMQGVEGVGTVCTWRCTRCSRPVYVAQLEVISEKPQVDSDPPECALANQLGCVEYSRPRRFWAMLNQWLTTTRALWPECPAVVSADRSFLSFPQHRGQPRDSR